MALAVHPDHAEVVVLGGSAIETSNASLFICTVQGPAATPALDYNPANDRDRRRRRHPAKDPTFIGRGVHADVHGATFAKRGATVDLWVGCDGGDLPLDARPGENYTWQSRNNGLAVTRARIPRVPPDHESVVILGTQDNGVLRRTGDTTWTWELAGDGGGVAFHPRQADRYMAAVDRPRGWRRTSHDHDAHPADPAAAARPREGREQQGQLLLFAGRRRGDERRGRADRDRHEPRRG